jgi:hypothetical protein
MEDHHMPKFYEVRFCWLMPVCTTVEVEVEDGETLTAAQIIQKAHDQADEEGWSDQKDIYDAISETFVDELSDNTDYEGAEEGPDLEIPPEWREDTIMAKHYQRVA